MLVMISVCMLTGCSSKSKEKEVIINTKAEVEKIVSSAVNSSQYMPGVMNQDYFRNYYLTASYDLTLELEEQYNNGKSINELKVGKYEKYSMNNFRNMLIGRTYKNY